MSPGVSIVLPTYNQARYLPAALEGVLAQTYSDWELIVVNDGSTDGTAEVLAGYQQQTDFTLIEQENQGLPRALNAGFSRARGRYLTWTSSDNVMMRDMLQVLVRALDDNPDVGLVYADFYLVDDQGGDLGRFNTVAYDPHWLLYTNLVHCCFLYRRRCMERIGEYDPEFSYSEDWEYWVRMSQYCRMKRVPQALYRYRLHEESLTGDIERGEAGAGYADFAARIRRRMPLRWYRSRLKRLWVWLTGRSHPAVAERATWLRASAEMAAVSDSREAR
jgi:glycosyltransferase involved in cell wall biosynthesis